MVITDTPEKEGLENEIQEKRGKGTRIPAAVRKLPAKRRAREPESSTDEDEELVKEFLGSDSDSTDNNQSETEQELASINVNPGVCVLVKFVTDKKRNKFYVGEVIAEVEAGYQVRFTGKIKDSAASFTLPDKEDIDSISFNDIILILSYPINVVGTKRAASKVMFRVDLGGFVSE